MGVSGDLNFTHLLEQIVGSTAPLETMVAVYGLSN